MRKKMLIPILFALGTALFWGLYGPTIGNAQTKVPPPEGWSPFKPYVFIGIAYVFLAIAGGLIAMKLKGDTYNYTGDHFTPAKWGFLAGCLGALGALCLTTAMMISKGNALLVMPIVFGGAVSVTAIVSLLRVRDDIAAGHTVVSPNLWVGMFLVVCGIVMVARNTPQTHGPRPAGSSEAAHSPAGPGHE